MTLRTKPDLFMPFFVGDYLADTPHLTPAQHGVYLLLLCAYWKRQGPLPNDEKILASISKLTPAQWRAMRPIILEFFTLTPEGTLVQKRAQAEIERAKKQKSAASASGKIGAEARWGARPDDGNARKSHGEAHGGPFGEHNDELAKNGMANQYQIDGSSPSPTPQNSLNTNSGSAREAFSRIVKAYPVRKGDPIPSTEVFWLNLCAAGKAPSLEPLLEAVAAYAAHLRKAPTEPVLFLRKFIGERWGAWLPDERPKTDVGEAYMVDWGNACGDAVASFKHSISPAHWTCFFAHARWDEASRQLQFASRFECDYVAQKWGEQLLAAFGEPFAIRHMPVRSVA
jgi:uncharacterized protein YdaU (DUF1376 family)